MIEEWRKRVGHSPPAEQGSCWMSRREKASLIRYYLLGEEWVLYWYKVKRIVRTHNSRRVRVEKMQRGRKIRATTCYCRVGNVETREKEAVEEEGEGGQ